MPQIKLGNVRGPQGLQGETGPEGPQGVQGPKGATGSTGPQGPIGVTGPQGPKGDKGDKGDTGAKGATGPAGAKGATGAAGPTGPRGPQGPRGPRGGGARFVVGTSKAGWTSGDCDYLCDGVDDQAEINAAINALPSTGGEVVVLDGTYNLTGGVTLSKSNVTLRGSGAATRLVLSNRANTVISSSRSRCLIADLACVGKVYLDGASGCVVRDVWVESGSDGIAVWGEDHVVVGNHVSADGHGIEFGAASSAVTGNVVYGGIYDTGDGEGTGNVVANNVVF